MSMPDFAESRRDEEPCAWIDARAVDIDTSFDVHQCALADSLLEPEFASIFAADAPYAG